MRVQLFARIHRGGEHLKNDFPNLLRTVIETKAWTHFADFEGKPFTNLVDWLHYAIPRGASMGQGRHALTYEDALKLTEHVPDVHRVLAENAPGRGRGGDRKSKMAMNQTVPTPFDRQHRHKGTAVLSARLAQEKPKFYDAYLSGKYKSITAAAIAAGILKDDTNLRRAKSAYRKMTPQQRAEFLKWMESPEAKEHYSCSFEYPGPVRRTL
jgi:hypothetical protein